MLFSIETLLILALAGVVEDRPPNVVIIFADDLGYGDVGAYGARNYKTPNIDRLASEGMRFTDFYVSQPVCSASRAALLTGCYSNRIGIHGALGPKDTHGIHSNEVTIAEILKPIGYATAVFGKWHLGHLPRFLPLQHGFDEYFGLPYSNDMWPYHPTSAREFPPLPLIEGNRIVERMPDQTKLTAWYTERAVKFIEKKKDRPFFLYLPHNMPHVPLHVSEARRGSSGAGLFGDVIEEIDGSVGEVLKAVEKHGLAEKTLIIFSSDNGPWLSYGNHAGSAGGLREGKGTVWEGGVRVPFIARWPGKIPPGSVCREPVMTIDLLPTIAQLAGGKLPEHRIDGKDIGALLRGEPGARTPHEALFFYYGVNELQALRSGRWKLILPHKYRTLEGKAGGLDGKPAPYAEREAGLELYDLENDPGETTDLARSQPDVVRRLEALVEATRDDLGDSLTRRAGRNVRAPGQAGVSYAAAVARSTGGGGQAKLLSKEVFLWHREGRPVATGFVTYISQTKPILMHCQGWEDYSDGYDDYAISLSHDNGRTWSEPEVRWKSVSVPEGRIRYAEPAAFFDPDKEKLLVLIDKVLYPKDKLDVDADYSLALDVYDTASGAWSERSELRFPGERCPAMSFSFPIKTASGRLLFPGMRKAVDASGKAVHYKGCWAPVDEVVTVMGEYDSRGEIKWRLGKPLRIDPELSSRGLDENALVELEGGRIAAVCRGDNSMFPEKRCFKWLSFSSDGGETWSPPAPFPATGGEPIESGANGSAFFRSIKNGRLYWIGNLALRGERAEGNWPRSPLVVVEVEEEPFSLKRETIFAVDERGYNDSPRVQLSNFRFYQDRETGDLVLFLTRYGEESAEKWQLADYYRYRVEIP
jgi:arylsulfatase A-like enzyme